MRFYVEPSPAGGYFVKLAGSDAPVSRHDTEEEALAAGEPLPDEFDETYLRAKLAAEEGVRARPVVDLTVLRPGRLTDDVGSGLVTLAPRVDHGEIPRDDVALVLLECLDAPNTVGVTFELLAGETPARDAVRAL